MQLSSWEDLGKRMESKYDCFSLATKFDNSISLYLHFNDQYSIVICEHESGPVCVSLVRYWSDANVATELISFVEHINDEDIEDNISSMYDNMNRYIENKETTAHNLVSGSSFGNIDL